MKPDNEFERLALPLRRELVAYCYRMTGSADEPEQFLPPRQRAVLILRDALGWPAADTGRMPAGATPQQITRISLFLDPGLFSAFGLPLALPVAVSSTPLSPSPVLSAPMSSLPAPAGRD